MQTLRRTLAASLLFVAATPAALAQCPLSSVPSLAGTGAIDRGRAIVSEWEPFVPPHVSFHEKTAAGWQHEQTFFIGTPPQIVYPLPVAIDGDRAIAGIPESMDTQGQAFVFDRVGGIWVQTELVSATVGWGDSFGSSVDVSGDVAVVGAGHLIPYGDQLGRVHVFEFDGTAWNEVAQLMTYGFGLDVEGDTIVVGDDRTFPGRVHVFRRVAGIWTWEDEVVVPTPAGSAYLGSAVVIRGDTLVVGASYPSQANGFVKVFTRQPDYWLETHHIVPSDSSPGDAFGYTVAYSGSTLLVGAPLADAVYRFERIGAGFVETARIGPEQPVISFGNNVAFRGEDAILSGYQEVSFYRLGFAQLASFCPTTPNSTGSPGSLSVEGCDSLTGQRLTLVAGDLPPGVLANFFFGGSAVQVPYGDGFRCVGPPLYRLRGGETDGAGRLAHDVG